MQPHQQVPSNLASGAGASNPFAGLTGARYAGQVPLPSASMFGPDGMFPLSVTDSLAAHQVPPSPEELQQMMHQPGFQQAMNQVLSDPRMVDYLIQSQPQLQAMGPGIRQYMQSDEFRRTMTDPTMLRNIFEMNRMFSQMGIQVPGMPNTQQRPSFPAPGVTDTTPQHQQHQQPANRSATGSPAPASQQQQPNPFTSVFPPPAQPAQAGTNPTNPFAALFGGVQQPQPGNQFNTHSGVQSPFGSPPPQGQQTHQQPNPFGTVPFGTQYPGQPPQTLYGQNPQTNPASMYGGYNVPALGMLFNPQGQGASAPGQGSAPFLPTPAAAVPPLDTRPIEERFQVRAVVTLVTCRKN
jgi:ubiquilin